MNRYIWMGFAAALAFAGWGMEAQAQKLYRCGNTYQETPCTGTQPSKEIRAGVPSSSSAAGSRADADCAQRGTNSQKITWARESGATAEKQIADVDAKGASGQQKAEQKQLIEAVYRKRGTAPEIRAAIEADCMAEKDKLRQAAALAAAAAGLKGEPSPAQQAATQTAKDEEAQRAADAKRQEAEQVRQARVKKARCDQLQVDLEEAKNRYRRGGTAQAMVTHAQERDRVEAKIKEQGCDG